MANNLDLNELNLDEIRLKIIKNMLAEFPELRIQITESMQIIPNKSTQETPKQKRTLKEYLNNSEIDSVPDWAKLAIASRKRNKKENRFYIFK
jgi:hypothetical protein